MHRLKPVASWSPVLRSRSPSSLPFRLRSLTGAPIGGCARAGDEAACARAALKQARRVNDAHSGAHRREGGRLWPTPAAAGTDCPGTVRPCGSWRTSARSAESRCVHCARRRPPCATRCRSSAVLAHTDSSARAYLPRLRCGTHVVLWGALCARSKQPSFGRYCFGYRSTHRAAVPASEYKLAGTVTLWQPHEPFPSQYYTAACQATTR
jgi:hypothetical protein